MLCQEFCVHVYQYLYVRPLTCYVDLHKTKRSLSWKHSFQTSTQACYEQLESIMQYKDAKNVSHPMYNIYWLFVLLIEYHTNALDMIYSVALYIGEFWVNNAQWKSVLVMGGKIFFIHLTSYFPSKYDLLPSLNDK